MTYPFSKNVYWILLRFWWNFVGISQIFSKMLKNPEFVKFLAGLFSAVSNRNFARKYALKSSRRDLHNALLCTALKSHFFKKLLEFSWTSPFRDRVAELRGPSEGLGGGCALLGCTAASRASVEQPIGTSRSSRSKRELVQFEMIQSDWFSILILDDHADLFFVNATTHQSTSSGERVVRR